MAAHDSSDSTQADVFQGEDLEKIAATGFGSG